MKNYLFLLFVASLHFQALMAQDSLQLKKITLKASITRCDGHLQEGYIQQVGDSSLLLSTDPIRFGAISPQNAIAQPLSYFDIESIKIRRKNSGARGALFGAITGIAIGVAAGLIEGDNRPPANTANQFNFHMHIGPETAGEKATVYGIAGGVLGAVLGATIGALVNKTFVIGGRKHDFARMKKNVLDRAYSKP